MMDLKHKITYCMVVLNRLEEMKIAIRRVAPYVTRTCVVDGGSTDGTIEWLSSQECKDLNVDFKVSKQVRLQYGNHTPRERNQYLEMAGHDGWLLYTDSDEFLEEGACRQLNDLVTLAEMQGCDGIQFRAHDIWTYETGEVYDNISDYFNPMMWKGYPGQTYVGHTHSGISRPGARNRWMRAIEFDWEKGPTGKFYEYHHVKTERRMWQNSTYLYWTTSGVAQNNTNDPIWIEFHELMKKYGHLDWHEFNKHMAVGNLPKEITDWFIEHKDAENPEERSWFVWYYIFNHPAENIGNIGNRDKEWDYVEKCHNNKGV